MVFIVSEESPSEIATDFEEQMRKGFLSIISLYLIDKEQSHSYAIKNKIKEITNGIWEPHYPPVNYVINKLEEKGLIEFVETGSRRKKIYGITDKGIRTLEMTADKLMVIIKTMRKMLVEFFGLDADYSVKDLF